MERDAELATLEACLDRAAVGSGRAVFLAGEAGVGKTSLVAEIVAAAAGWRLRRGASDRLESPTALAPLSDAFPELADEVEDTAEGERRRLFRRLRVALTQERTLLVLEDLHWADEATLGFLRFVVRRLDDLPLLLLATYRDDEVTAGGPLAVLLGDLVPASAVTRIAVRPLSAFGVAELVRRERSSVPASDLHRRTGGNPFFVTEVLATGSDTVPATVRDAVMARTATVTGSARRVLDAASVAGPGSEVGLVLAAADAPAAALDECVERGLLVSSPDSGTLSFRHELAREAVQGSLLPSQRDELNRAVLRWLLAMDEPDHRRIATHAAAARESALVLAHAPPAASRAARMGAHRESAELYRMALLHSAGLPDRDRATLLDDLSYQCYLTDQLEESLEHRRTALALYGQSGLREKVGDAQRWLSRLSWFAARGPDARRFAVEAVATLEPLGPSTALAMAYSNRSQVAMLAADTAEAVSWGTRAIELSRELGASEVEAHALNNVGTARLMAGDVTVGTTQLEHSLDLSLAQDFEEHAARAYTNLFAESVAIRQYRTAERYGREGIAYTTERDLDSWRRYMTAWQAVLLAELGRFDEADAAAASVLEAVGVAPVARIPGLVAGALLRARTGRPEAAQLLDEAQLLAVGSDESQRLLPVALARAELAWLDDAGAAVAVEGLARVVRDRTTVLTRWERGEASWWLHLLAGEDRLPGEVAEPWAAMFAGDWPEAARAWEAVGSPVWKAVAQLRSTVLDDARAGLDALAGLGAVGTHAAAIRDRHRLQLPVPREPRATTRANSAGLTAREMDVLRLLADGMTNAEIAASLVLSERTVDHHVSAVLRKLDAPTRARAVATATRDGLLGGGIR